MEVKVRHLDAAESVHFCDCKFNEIDKIVAKIQLEGGIYCSNDSEMLTEITYQFVLVDDSCYAEILVGNDGF